MDFTTFIERQTFERVCSDLFEKIIEPVEETLREAKLKTEDIDDLGLMGCQTTSPPFVKARL